MRMRGIKGVHLHCKSFIGFGHLSLSAAKRAKSWSRSEWQAASSPVRQFSASSLARRLARQPFSCASSSTIVGSGISEKHALFAK